MGIYECVNAVGFKVRGAKMSKTILLLTPKFRENISSYSEDITTSLSSEGLL